MPAIIYSIVSYIGFLAVFTYLALFSDGLFVPKTVDTGSAGDLTTAVVLDLGLMLLFGLQHSIMARAPFKRAITRIIPESVERATFVLASSLVVALMMWQWRPIPNVLWHAEDTSAVAVLWSINALGWLGVPLVSFMIDHFDLFGVKQTLHAYRKTTLERKGFVTPLLYKYVRHPMMTSFLVALWVTPHMTAGHFLFSLGMSAYIMVGVHFEERSLARELGAPYELYQAQVPMFLPIGSDTAAQSEPRASSAAIVGSDPGDERALRASTPSRQGGA